MIPGKCSMGYSGFSGAEHHSEICQNNTVPLQNVYKRFLKWSKAGVFKKIFEDLSDNADMQDISIDSACIKAHKASAGANKEKS